MTPPRRGRLLVAAPSLDDPNFFRTVVLLLAYDEQGALGVVLNRPSEIPVAELVPTWALSASTPGVVFSGGPVQQNAAICVGCHGVTSATGVVDGAVGEQGPNGDEPGGDEPGGDEEGDGGELVGGFSPLTSTLGTVDLHREPEDISVKLEGLRIFKGYAGWGGGQLDDEIADSAWIVVECSSSDVLTEEPGTLWERVLRRQGGWLSVLARHPVDPSVN